MLIMGIDLGTSSVKVSVTDASSGKSLASATYPEQESAISSLKKGWAEQDPEMWWNNVKQAILKCHSVKKYNPADIKAIGIAYQMHGLVLVDKSHQVLRPSIIWCDSRAVEIGEKAFEDIGHEYCLSHLLNSPGNFTASKLAWVKEYESKVYNKIYKVMLPGDYISMKLTGEISTTIEALSEGIFWDFKKQQVSAELLNYYELHESMLPEIKDVFSIHGTVAAEIANELSLTNKIPVAYKSGDQPNNALSLNVMEPGEIAATAGTSGVIYGISDQLTFDHKSRINSFAHVNHNPDNCRIGVLLCINGVGILNKWIRNATAPGISYHEMNRAIETIEAGADGLRVLPFGNGAERMLNNKTIGTHFSNIDLNIHTTAHLYRGVQEGIAFAFRYGIDIMRENGMDPSVIRAGNSNLFLSKPFVTAFVNTTGIPVQLYDGDGSVGAAIGAGIGAHIFESANEAFSNVKIFRTIHPESKNEYEIFYREWKDLLNDKLSK